jgi:hypothetical protein
MYFFYGWTGRKKEKTPEKALTLTDKYNEVVARLQQSNKFRILLDQYADAQMLEGEIKEWLRKNGTRYDADKLCTAFDYVKEYYGRDLRKDGKTPKAAHALSVARGVAILGGDFESVLAALFHDLVEDCGDEGARHDAAKVSQKIKEIGGSKVLDMVLLLTRDRNKETYRQYLERVYGSNNVYVMVIKALDTLENLKTLFFEGCEESFIESTVRKALYHVKLWQKTNWQFFGLMLELIKAADRPELRDRIAELETRSTSQLAMERRGYEIVNWRGHVTFSLLLQLPNADSPVLIVYRPDAMEPIDYVEVEFPSFMGGSDETMKILKKHLGWMNFKEAQSRLPENLRETAIFRAKRPALNEAKRFLDGIERIGMEIKNSHGTLSEFFKSFKRENIGFLM